MLYYIIYKYHCTVIQIDIILYVHITRIDPSNIIQLVSLKQDRNTLIHVFLGFNLCTPKSGLEKSKNRADSVHHMIRMCSPYRIRQNLGHKNMGFFEARFQVIKNWCLIEVYWVYWIWFEGTRIRYSSCSPESSTSWNAASCHRSWDGEPEQKTAKWHRQCARALHKYELLIAVVCCGICGEDWAYLWWFVVQWNFL